MQQYGGSVAKTLLDIYGFIGLQPHKFNTKSSRTYISFHFPVFILIVIIEIPKEVKMRKFFDEYAANNNFDPLIPENWYKLSYTDLEKAKVQNSFYCFYVLFFV